jgi:hypothetical protein
MLTVFCIVVFTFYGRAGDFINPVRPRPSRAVFNIYKLFAPRACRYSTSSATMESNYSIHCSSGPASDAIIFLPFHLLLMR